MAAVEVTITGTLYDKLNRTTQQVVLIGEASLTGIGVGGGPVIPPGQPPGQPQFPIALPPGSWPGGGAPPGPGYPPSAEHPIAPTPPPTDPPPIDPTTPPVEWKAVWTPENGWMVVGVPNVPHPAPSS